MKRYKYKYNSETLQFNTARKSVKQKIRKLIILSGFLMLGAILINFCYSLFFFQTSEIYYQKKNVELKNKCQTLSNDLSLIEIRLVELQEKDDNYYRPLLEVDPLSQSIRTAGYGGTLPYDSYTNLNNSGFIIDANHKLDRISSKLYVQSRSFEKLYWLAIEKNKLKSCIPAIRPISKEFDFFISSGYGYRRDPFTKRLRAHHGLDFAASIGVPIYATGDSKVIKIRYSRWGYGNEILLDHGYGYRTRYAHIDKINVTKGEIIKRGQQIGTMGNTGRSTGPHLHYEVIVNDHPVNPWYYYMENLSDDEYELIVEQAKEN